MTSVYRTVGGALKGTYFVVEGSNDFLYKSLGSGECELVASRFEIGKYYIGRKVSLQPDVLIREKAPYKVMFSFIKSWRSRENES